MIYVRGEGPANAKLAVIGEAPGRVEEQEGGPFRGATGKMVRDCLRKSGYDPDEVYLTNVCKIRPPDNQIRRLSELGPKIEDFYPQLWEELEKLQPNAVLALGNTALRALTGETGIEKFRGSILESSKGYPKIIPTIHPAALLHGEGEGTHSWKDLVYIQWDFDRAFCQSKFKEIRRPERTLRICHSSLDFYRFLDDQQKKPFVSCDIETFRTIPICISLAFSSREAMCIQLIDSPIPTCDLAHIWKDLADVLADPRIGKIGQNFKFDEGRLEERRLKVNGFYFDTMLGFRTLYPELKGSLQFITSVLTEEPYYKDEGKEFNPKKDKIDRLLNYCNKDSLVTFEAYEQELKELEELGIADFFFDRVMPLHPFYSRLERRGIKRDNDAQKRLKEKYSGIEEEREKELEALIGYKINVNSPKQISRLLWEELKVPRRKDTGEETLDALARNSVKDDKKIRVIRLILELRKLKKVQSTYVNARTHKDGRLRTGYRIMLETGRTSTSVLKPPVTEETMGIAFQTITKHGEVGSDLREMFIPDEGYVFLEPDLSQAEARVVALLARDERLLALFEHEIDIHCVTASWLFDRPLELLDNFLQGHYEKANELRKKVKGIVDETERQLGKKFRHAGHYDMGKHRASEITGLSEWRAGKTLEKFHSTNPGIREIFHSEIRNTLGLQNRIIFTPFGRRRQFLNKWSDDLFKEAYAYIPQSTVSDQLKFAAQRIEKRLSFLMILQESHDSFLSQCPIGKVDESIRIIKEELEVPIDFSKCSLPRGELLIPCEIKIGKKNWMEMEKLC